MEDWTSQSLLAIFKLENPHEVFANVLLAVVFDLHSLVGLSA